MTSSVPNPTELNRFTSLDLPEEFNPTSVNAVQRKASLTQIHCDTTACSIVPCCAHTTANINTNNNTDNNNNNNNNNTIPPDSAAVKSALNEIKQLVGCNSSNTANIFLSRPPPASIKSLSLYELVQSVSAELAQSKPDLHLIYYYMLNYNAELNEWKRYAFYDLNRKYTRNLIATDNRTFTLMLLCWNPNMGSPVHNHSGSECFMRAVEGKILESQYKYKDDNTLSAVAAAAAAPITHYYSAEDSLTAGTNNINNTDCQLELKHTVLHSAGNVAFINDSLGLHKVENIYSEPAVTLHLYIPPYDACKCYSESTGHSCETYITFYSEHGEKVEQH